MAVMGRPLPRPGFLSTLGALRPRAPEFCIMDEDFFPGGTPFGEPRRHSEVLSLASHLGGLAQEFREAL